MNLPPSLAEQLVNYEIEATHWASIGQHNSADEIIFQYAQANGFVVVTHDLDFGAILAATGSRKPSVIQIRTADLLSESIAGLISETVKQYGKQLDAGALVSINANQKRVRVLPLG